MERSEQQCDSINYNILGSADLLLCHQVQVLWEQILVPHLCVTILFQNSLPLEEILSLYQCKPVASFPNQQSKVPVSHSIRLFISCP